MLWVVTLGTWTVHSCPKRCCPRAAAERQTSSLLRLTRAASCTNNVGQLLGIFSHPYGQNRYVQQMSHLKAMP